jgi:hypothetical protein
VAAQKRAELRARFRGHLIPDQEAIDFAGQILRGHRLLEDDFQEIHAVKVSRTAQKRFLAGVVLVRVHLERKVVEVPPGKRARAFAHVLL